MNCLSVVVLTLIALNGAIDCFEYTDCGSDDGKVDSIQISGCSESDSACNLHSGSDASIDIKFTPGVDSKKAVIKIWGIIAGVIVPFNIASDACDKWSVNCPLSKGTSNELKVKLPVLAEYPKISVQVKMALLDEDDKNLFCTEFPAKIV